MGKNCTVHLSIQDEKSIFLLHERERSSKSHKVHIYILLDYCLETIHLFTIRVALDGIL